jgi:uncharacterized protein YqgC (DUF456 family)
MVKQFLHYFRIASGVILILVGIAGVVLPVLPGWILIFIGIELLGIQLVFLDKTKEYVKQKIDQSTKKKRR